MKRLAEKNVYQKLQEARVKLQQKDIKKSGENKYAGYKYYELSDFMQPINEILNELGLFSQVTFTREQATLSIVNTEKPEEFVCFTSPMAEASLKGCHEIQNLGAVETYQRRYLYMMAFEITEADPLDATTGKEGSQKPQNAQNQKKNNSKGSTSNQGKKEQYTCSDCSTSIKQAVHAYSEKHFGRALCMECQEKEKGVKDEYKFAQSPGEQF